MEDMIVQGIQALKPASSYTKTQVSRGLYIGVATNGDKTFFVRYTVNGSAGRSEYRLPRLFGIRTSAAYLSLADARAKAAEIKALAKQCIDYQKKLEADATAKAAKTAEDEAKNYTVQDLYDAWFPTTRRKDGGAELSRVMKRDVLPVVGALKLTAIEEGHIRKMLAPVAGAGTNRKAVVILNNVKQMFHWSNGRKPWKLLVNDPTANLKSDDITQPNYEEVERDRILSHDEIRALANLLPDARLIKTTEIIIWLTLSCCTRVGETTMAEWEHVNLDTCEWFIPEANMKGRAPAHTVYLSQFATAQFRALKITTGSSNWCFPNADDSGHLDTKAATKQITARQFKFSTASSPINGRTMLSNSLVLGDEKWTPHDLRRTGASLMQSLGVNDSVIERVINHVEQNRMKRIYHRYDHADEMRNAWAALGTLLSNFLKRIASEQPIDGVYSPET